MDTELENTRRTLVVDVGDEPTLRRLGGAGHENFRVIADALRISVGARGEQVHLAGDEENVQLAARFVRALVPIVKRVKTLRPSDTSRALELLRDTPDADLRSVFLDVVVQAKGGRDVTPKGPGQKIYVDSIRQHDVTFALGPAGTGKTYLAMALAVHAFKQHQVSRIILTRPAVEAGERLGFLPGDLEAKVNPYLRPLYDALYDLMGMDAAQDLVGRRMVEVAPLAFMRGRTLNDSFIILDEAQNTTPEQMKMFLTRLGFGSKAVVTGDVTQVDLPRGQHSGLLDSIAILEGIEGIGVVRLTDRDVVRHPLVQRVVRAYERAEQQRTAQHPPDSHRAEPQRPGRQGASRNGRGHGGGASAANASSQDDGRP